MSNIIGKLDKLRWKESSGTGSENGTKWYDNPNERRNVLSPDLVISYPEATSGSAIQSTICTLSQSHI